MAHDVFVSYSNKDKAIADSIVASMESNQVRCWYAPRDIQPGEDWGKAITNGILASKLFLIIFSSNANRSQRVLDELNFAVSKEIAILPFRIENLEPEGAMGLHLSSRHWLDAYEPSWEIHIKKLVKNVSAILKNDIDESQIIVPDGITKKAKQKPQKVTQILAGILLGVILVAAGWYGFSRILPGTSPETKPNISEISTESISAKSSETTTPQFANENSSEPTLDANISDSINANYPLLGYETVPISALLKSIPWLPLTYMKGLQVSKFININRDIPPLDDPLIRKALSMAIDREKIAELANGNRECYGEVSPASTLIPPDILSRDLYSVIGLKFYPDSARTAMEQAGFPDGEGFPILEMVVAGCEEEVMLAIISMWKENLGILVTPVVMEDRRAWNGNI